MSYTCHVASKLVWSLSHITPPWVWGMRMNPAWLAESHFILKWLDIPSYGPWSKVVDYGEIWYHLGCNQSTGTGRHPGDRYEVAGTPSRSKYRCLECLPNSFVNHQPASPPFLRLLPSTLHSLPWFFHSPTTTLLTQSLGVIRQISQKLVILSHSLSSICISGQSILYQQWQELKPGWPINRWKGTNNVLTPLMSELIKTSYTSKQAAEKHQKIWKRWLASKYLYGAAF